MEPTVFHIEPEFVHRVWDDAHPFLKECEKYGNEYTIEHLKVDIIAGRADLFMVSGADGEIVGAVITEFITHPNARIGFIKAYGGNGSTTEATVDQLKQWLRVRGATSLQCAVRGSMARFSAKHGFSPRYVIMEQPL